MAVGWIVAWLSVVAIIGLNGFAAGIVAIFHAWRVKLPRESRMFLASAIAGFLPASALGGVALAGTVQDGASGGAMTLLIVFGVCFVVALILSLPGAIIVARRLDHPGDDFRIFE